MIRFLLARLLGDEAALKRYSKTSAEVTQALAGKTVAIVGNARALGQTQQGATIEAADLIIRINGAPIPDPSSHGARTDWIALSTPIPSKIVTQRAPQLCLWMTRKRRRIPWHLARFGKLHVYPAEASRAIASQLGHRPTTGLMVIDLVRHSEALEIHLHGFDFFASQSLSGSRTAAQVPHDFWVEKAYVEALLAADPRVTLHPMI